MHSFSRGTPLVRAMGFAIFMDKRSTFDTRLSTVVRSVKQNRHW